MYSCVVSLDTNNQVEVFVESGEREGIKSPITIVMFLLIFDFLQTVILSGYSSFLIYFRIYPCLLHWYELT